MRCLISMPAILRPSPRDTGYSSQIGPCPYVFKATLLHQQAHGSVLPEPMFDQAPPAALEVAANSGNDFPERIEAIGAGHERGERLEAQIGEVRVTVGHVRRVGDHDVEALARHG